MVQDNLAQLDQGGSNCQWVRTYLGPTLGWVMLPVMPELIVTSAAPYTIPAYASRVLFNAAVKVVNLPSVTLWVEANPPLANISPFDRSLWLKDYSYQASGGAPIVVNANGFDTIDGQPNFSIVEAGELIRLYPMTNLVGWYVG